MSATLDTEKADVLTGLIRRDGGRYSTRRIIPLDLRPAYGGKREIVKALGTADPAEAKRLHVALWAAQDREFAGARAAMAAAEKTPAVETKAAKPIDIDAYAARALVGLRKKRAEYLAAGRLENFNLEAREGLEIYQAILDGGDDLDLSLSEAEGMRVATLAILTGEGAAALAAAPAVKPTASGGPRVPLADVLDKWKAERTPQPRTVRDLTRTVKRFEAVVGKLAVQDVTKQHVIAFKDALLSEGKTPGNINVIIPFLGTLFNYAVDNDLIPASPAKGIKVVDKRRAKDKRLHYDRDELKAVFNGPVHMDGARPVGGGGEAAYWLPLLALYTGARQTELGQLHPDDVYEEAYLDEEGGEHSAWVIRFAENEKRGQKVKTEGSERRIPIHSDLIGLGFLKVAAAAKAERRERIFHKINPTAEGELMGNWSKWFGRYLRKVCGVADERVVFHSFRHSFKHYARNCRLDKEVHAEITGHESGDTGDDYGGLAYPLHPLVEGMARYRVPGFILPPPPSSLR
ncbi:site-specific integrase [Brevundimonas sp. UBA7534]|uniref:site-specific integrase n=1 Tax=Brevundimonas sp. UBA7534 TaxID=1946138 RepID=UPI0025B9ED00|nr:site-specific integrase [Brevundimonas sp. UBA7534]